MKQRKLKRNINFKPLPIDEGDEHFANGIFVFNVTKLLGSIRANAGNFPVELVEVETLAIWDAEGLNEATIQSADLSEPIVLAEISPGRFNVIDGNHRLEKARRENVEKIPARRVLAEEHLAFLTSVRAYEAYISYWNSKIKEGCT